MLSPLTITLSLFILAILSLILYIILLIIVIKYSWGQFLYIACCISVNLITWILISLLYTANLLANSITLFLASILVWGGLSKYIHSNLTPLLIAKYPATGESIPPLSINKPVPCTPTGYPPIPLTLLK